MTRATRETALYSALEAGRQHARANGRRLWDHEDREVAARKFYQMLGYSSELQA